MTKSNDQRGGIMIVVTILSVVLILFLAWALDSSIAMIGKAKQRRVTEYMALAALESYAATDPGVLTGNDAYRFKIEAALTRASEVGGLETNISLSERLTHSGRTEGTLNLSDRIPPLALDPDHDGRINFGIWYFAEPPDNALPPPVGGHCLIGPGGTFSPCFEANDPATATLANAVLIEFRSRDTSIFRPLFGVIGGFGGVQMLSSATAAFQPRRMVFATDMSGSTDDDSHGTASRYAFRITAPPCPAPTPADTTLGYYTFDNTPPHTNMWNAMPVGERQEYRCYPVTYQDPDDGGAPRTEYYLIDENPARPPRPLFPILSGVHQAMENFRLRSVRGDEIAFIGFDHEILNERRTTMMRVGTTEFDEWYAYTDTVGGSNADRIQQALLFPRADRDNDNDPSTPGAAFTDMPSGIEAAETLLSGGTGILGADNSIVMFSDGLSNCKSWSSPKCRMHYTNYILPSLDRIQTTIMPRLRDNGITFNMVLFGTATVKAHRLVYRSAINPNRCAEESETRAEGWSLTDADQTTGDVLCLNPMGLCTKPNSLAVTVTNTGGLWTPIVPACNRPAGGGGGVCDSGVAGDKEQLRDYLNSQCALGTIGMPVGNIPGTPNYTDSRGRISCDTGCRSNEQQVAEVIEQLLRDNPFQLVDSVYQ